LEGWGWLVGVGFALIMLGVLLVFLGVLAGALRSGGDVEAGGVIIIGPIPIVFGTSGRAALAAAILGLVMLVLALIIWLQARGVVAE